jgi:GT2 family glycosyltransferase
MVIALDENKGFAIANNIGTNGADGKYLAFLNNDTIVTPNWLNELVSVMESDDCVAITQSRLLRLDGEVDSTGDFATHLGRVYNSTKDRFDEPRKILSARGAAMLVRKTFFLAEGGFDKDYFVSFEDVEIGWKAWILGYKVLMVPNSLVYHKAGSTTSNMSSLMSFHGLKNHLSLISTHFEGTTAIRNLAIVSAILFASLIKLIIKRGDESRAFTVDKKAAINAVFWYLQNLTSIWNKHRALNARRKISTKELIGFGLITKRINDQ